MPPKRSSRKRGRDPNFVVFKVEAELALVTLAGNTALSGALHSLADDVYLISADLTWSIRNHTAGEGPIEVGLSQSGMSAANIIEALDASPVNRGDRIALERSGRPVREVGQFPGLLSEEVLNNGNLFRTKIKFVISETQTLSMYGVNRSGAALTTGTVVGARGKIYARWK